MKQLATLSSVYHLLPSQFIINSNSVESRGGLSVRTSGSVNPPANTSDLANLTPEDISKSALRDQEPEELLIAF